MRVILETRRLLLREMEPADIDFVASMLAHPEVMRHYPKCLTLAEAEAWLGQSILRYARDGSALWLAVERATGLPVGQIGLLLQQVDGVPEPEVGYLLHRPYWRRGFATEGASAVRDLAFSRGSLRVISLIRPENVASKAVARRLGMQIEKRALHMGLEHLVFAVSAPAEGRTRFSTRRGG